MAKEDANLWWVEIESFSFDDAAFRAAECAELADELDLYRLQALGDNGFEHSIYDWDCYVVENSLWLPLEQSCHDGVLLPMDQRALRVKTCPEDVLSKLRWFFELCPAHVKHHLALMYYVAVRVDRARRTGSPEWRALSAVPLSPLQDAAFFRPPLLTYRKYGR